MASVFMCPLLITPHPFVSQIDKLVLEAEYIGDPSMAPREYMTLTSTAQVRPAVACGRRAALCAPRCAVLRRRLVCG